MRPVFAWLVLLILAVAAAWQLLAARPLISPIVAGFVMLVLGMLAGLRIGADSVGRFVKDLTRLNTYLAEQNRDLVEMNYFLLGQLLLQKRESADSTDPHPTDET